MNLLSPWLLLGLLGLAGPVLAHLLGRRRPKEIWFAAHRFLAQGEPTLERRRTLQDWPLFVLRLLLLALLVLALTRPTTRESGDVTVVADPHDAVLLLDASRSMGLRVEGRTLLEHAARRAKAVLAALPSGSRIGLLTSDPGGPRIEPTADPGAIENALAEWLEQDLPRPGAWPLAAALPTAAAMLDGLGGDRERYVYAIGDRSGDGLAGLPVAAEGGITVLPIAASEAALPEHVGIVGATWEPAPELDPRAVRIEARLRRFVDAPEPGDDDPLEVSLGLFVADDEVARARARLPPAREVSVEFTHTLLGDDDAVAATLRILGRDDDPLPSDDARHLWLAADVGLEVLVVNGDPSELRAHDEVFFLTTAIAASGDHRLRLRSLAPDQLDDVLRKQGARALAEARVLVLGNVRAPAPDIAPVIVERVRAGMGLLVTVGDRIDSRAYNERLGKLLPLLMRDAVQVGTAPGRTEARALGLAPANLGHPVFRGLEHDPGLTGTQARRVVLLEPDPERTVDIALSFTNGAPALLTAERGEGRVALLTTTIDRDWADLPLRPGFVPLVDGTLAYLGGGRSGVAGSEILVGEERLLHTNGPIALHTPDGRELSLVPEDGVVLLRETFVTGHHRLHREGDGDSMFVVNVDPSESDTRTHAIASPATAEGAEQVFVSRPRWRTLVLLAVLLLGLESILRFRARSWR